MSNWNDFTQKLASAFPYISGLLAIGGTIWNGVQQRKMNKELIEANRQDAREQRDWYAQQNKEQNKITHENWVESNEYNTPTAQKERLVDAGLNPMYYGIDGVPSAPWAAAQPLGYERATFTNMPNPVTSMIDAFAKLQETSNSTRIANAQEDKMNAETKGLFLDNQFKQDTLAAREEGVRLANAATKKDIEEADSRIKVNLEEVKKKQEETKNEIEKRGLIIAEKLLAEARKGEAEAKTKEILEMLPLNKKLAEASTLAQKAYAANQWASYAINKGLLDGGYVQKQLDELSERIRKERGLADDAQWKARIDEMKAAIMSGNAFDLTGKDPISKAIGEVANSFFSILSVASNAGFAGIKL